MKTSPIKRQMVLFFIIFVQAHYVLGDDEWCSIDGDDISTASLKPELIDASSQKEDFELSDKVTLYCCFGSKHSVQVKWYKDNVPIMREARYQFGENNQVLSVDKATMSDDNTTYRCEGRNQHGRQSWNITLNIHLPPCQAPTLYSPKSNVMVNSGQNVTLTCIVQPRKDCSTILPSFYWKSPQGRILVKNSNTKVVPNSNDVRMSLTIKHVRKCQAGAYKCIAYYNLGATASSTKWLYVK